MDTTTAAEKAKVSARTIQRWCQRGIIAATKTAGRWAIDADSLLRKIQPKGKAMTEINADNLRAIGGEQISHWIVIKNWPRLIGLRAGYENGRHVAYLDGEQISPVERKQILRSISQVTYDLYEETLRVAPGSARPRIMTRDELRDRIVASIHQAIEQTQQEGQ